MGPTEQRQSEPGEIHYVVVSDPCNQLLAANGGADFVNALLAEPIGEGLDKPGLDDWRDRRRIEMTDPAGRARTAYLKRYRRPPRLQQIRRILFGDRARGTAWRDWQAIGRLTAAGVDTISPIVYAQKMRGMHEIASCVLVEAVSGESLERSLARHAAELTPAQRRRWVLRLAEMIARLHGAGLCHRDLYLSHVFVDAADPDRPRFCLIDLQRVFAPRWRRRRWRIKDLAQLDYSSPAGVVTRTDRWRFLSAYLGQARHDRRRRWAQSIERKASQIAVHDARRQRRLGIGS